MYNLQPFVGASTQNINIADEYSHIKTYVNKKNSLKHLIRATSMTVTMYILVNLLYVTQLCKSLQKLYYLHLCIFYFSKKEKKKKKKNKTLWTQWHLCVTSCFFVFCFWTPYILQLNK